MEKWQTERKMKEKEEEKETSLLFVEMKSLNP